MATKKKKAKRNYRKEYLNYGGKPEQKKRRAKRNAARNKLIKAGKVHKGDGKDVNHRSGNPNDNSAKNLQVQTAHANRSYPRTKTARKKNPRD